MASRLRLCAAVMLAMSAGCVALGWRFGPGYSLSEKPMDLALFAEPPRVERRGAEHFLVWTQGDYPYFFQPEYRAMNGRLVFALGGTTSTGSLAGRHRELRIEGAENILALERGGAAWWEREPELGGRLVELQVVKPATAAGSAVVPSP